MTRAVRLSGIGLVISHGDPSVGSEGLAVRLSSALAALLQSGHRIRLFHPIEEAAFLAAHDALSSSGVPVPVGRDSIGIALGVDEGIDGIKARHWRAVLNEGPLGASPIAFPFTTPNSIAAQLSIGLDLRGENLTVCGGSLSGAQAIGLALEAIREGRCGAMLAGGATSVEQEFLEALSHAGRPDTGPSRWGACLLLVEPHDSERRVGGTAELLGYAEGFGENGIQEAVRACLEDARLLPGQIGSIRVASAEDGRALIESLRQVGAAARLVSSPSAGLYSASFPMAVAEATGKAEEAPAHHSLVVGTDCLGGASAAIVRGSMRR